MTLPGSIGNIQKLRGAAALMVLLVHINGGEEQFSGPAGILPQSFDIGHAGVDLFFLISGFVMVYSTRSADRRMPFPFIRTRLIRIYPIYWLILATTVLLFMAKETFFREPVDYSTVIADALLVPTGQQPFLVVAWTLIHELYFYLVFMASLCFRRAMLPWVLIVWLFILALGNAAGLGELHPVAAIIFSPLTVEFIVGVCIGLLVIGGSGRGGVLSFVIGIAWLSGITVWRIYADAPVFPSGWQRVLLCVPPLALILYGAIVVELNKALKENRPGPAGRFFLKLGDSSYVLYLVHLPIMLVVGKLWSPLATPRIWDNIVLILLWTVIAVAASLFLHTRVEKPLIGMLKRTASAIWRDRG